MISSNSKKTGVAPQQAAVAEAVSTSAAPPGDHFSFAPPHAAPAALPEPSLPSWWGTGDRAYSDPSARFFPQSELIELELMRDPLSEIPGAGQDMKRWWPTEEDTAVEAEAARKKQRTGEKIE